jgi:hypothetical protein
MYEQQNGRGSLKKWLLENYPVESVFIDEINKTVNKMYQHAGIHANLKENEPKPLLFQTVKRHETEYAELMMDPSGVLFLGGMAKAISDIILKQMLPNIQPETKKCVECNTVNNKIFNYCYQCGNKFETDS